MSDCIYSLKMADALAHGHAAIDLMGDHRIAPSAQNYEVWLSYRLGSLSELRREIEERIAQGLPFTDEFNQTLHDRYFSNVRLTAQMAETGEELARALSSVIDAIATAGEDSGEYGRRLQEATTRLNENVGPEGLRTIISTIVVATRRMVSQNQKLTSQLRESSQHLDQVRHTLRQVRTEALTDSLTGLANRRLFDESLREKLRVSQTTGKPLTLVLCDIDHFKRFNDTWGHQTGDQILRFVASTLQRTTHPTGIASRYGGEEFALILPDTTLAAAQTRANQIRAAIESKTLVRKSTGEDLGRITVSAGIAAARVSDTESTLIARADSCLYAAKRAGRNRVFTEEAVQSSAA